MPNQLELIGGAYGQILRDFLTVSHNDDGTLRNQAATTLANVLAASNDAGGLKIANLGSPAGASDAATKGYVDGVAVVAQTLTAVLGAGNSAGNLGIANLADPVGAQDAATKHYVDTTAGGTQNLNSVLGIGNDAGAHKITNLAAPTVASDAVTKSYVDARNLAAVLAAGSDAGATRITNLGAPTVTTDATTKAYVDGLISGLTRTLAQVLAAGADAGGIAIANLGAPVNQTDAATKGYVDAMTFSTQSGSAYTLVLSDQGKVVVLTNAVGPTLTIPTNASVAFPLGTIIVVRAGTSAAPATIAGASGVTVFNPYNSFTLAGAAAEATLLKIGTDSWSLNGEVA